MPTQPLLTSQYLAQSLGMRRPGAKVCCTDLRMNADYIMLQVELNIYLLNE